MTEPIDPRKPRPYVRPAVPVVPGKPLTCRWCSSRLGQLKGVYICPKCDVA